MKLVPTFRSLHAMGTNKLTILTPLIDLKSPKTNRRLWWGDFRSELLAFLPLVLTALLVAMVGVAPPTHAQTKLDKVSFGTNWVPEAEHGGFYQALADGTYQKYGLDVTIVPGGPNENNRMLLILTSDRYEPHR